MRRVPRGGVIKEVPMSQRTLPSDLGDRCLSLEVITRVLCGAPLTDPFADLASWGVGVEVIKGLERAGFQIVRDPAGVPAAAPEPAVGDVAH